MTEDARGVAIFIGIMAAVILVIGAFAWATGREHDAVGACPAGTVAVTTIEGAPSWSACVVGEYRP